MVMSTQRLSETELWDSLSELIAREMGLYFPPEKYTELERALRQASSEFGFKEMSDFASWLLSHPLDREKLTRLAHHLTIGETYFFRDPFSFRALEEQILPALIEKKKATNRRLRIWCAGCCTGEEAYSIAMVLTKLIPDWSQWTISLLGTDIDVNFLRKARKACYSDWSFRNSWPGIKEKYFQKMAKGRYQMNDDLRNRVNFTFLNLVKDQYPTVASDTTAMDIIFCRNVLMYFKQDLAYEVVERLGQCLVEGGWLFLSPVDIPNLVVKHLVPVHFTNTIAYQKTAIATSPETDSVSEIQEEPSLFVSRPQSQAMSQPEPIKQSQPESFMARAISLFIAGQYTQLIKESMAALSSHCDDDGLMLLVARAYANLGDLNQAKFWCEKALSLNQIKLHYYCVYALILQELGLEDQLEKTLKQGLYLDQNNLMLQFLQANFSQRRGDFYKAKRYFHHLLNRLAERPAEEILEEFEGLTAGRLIEFIQSTLALGA